MDHYLPVFGEVELVLGLAIARKSGLRSCALPTFYSLLLYGIKVMPVQPSQRAERRKKRQVVR